ncbi:hypothetical protein ACCO45_002275 [Purpureocillium lilacinum]|uniref:Uncharacterized protein n=1 Tax=Purpureocillium lilacinum TaxID=33203 RepID=A0ACC4E9Z4_PURLI
MGRRAGASIPQQMLRPRQLDSRCATAGDVILRGRGHKGKTCGTIEERVAHSEPPRAFGGSSPVPLQDAPPQLRHGLDGVNTGGFDSWLACQGWRLSRALVVGRR